MGFFSAVRNIGSKVAQGASWLGGKVAKVGNVVANVAEKIAPAVGVIGSAVGVPEAGMIAKTIGEGARTAANFGQAAQDTANKYLQGQRVS